MARSAPVSKLGPLPRASPFDRQQIIDSAWGQDTSLTDRVVDTHALNLRKKIESEPARPRFLTSVRGMGYRFDGWAALLLDLLR